jgi:hypothetical protein
MRETTDAPRGGSYRAKSEEDETTTLKTSVLCRLCETEQRPIKAHVVPEGFFRALRDDSGVIEMRTNKPGVPPKRAPIGVYDTTILCGPCDNVFSPWDKHAQDVLLRDFSKNRVIYDGSAVIGWTIEEFDYKLLKLFFVSLLWRASVSTHEFYRRIDLKPFEQQMRDMILAGDPGAPETFAVTLARFDHPAYRGVFDPHRERFGDGINYVRFYLSGFVAHLKVDRRPPPDFLSGLVVRPGAPIRVPIRSRHGKDAEAMRGIARASAAWKRSR